MNGNTLNILGRRKIKKKKGVAGGGGKGGQSIVATDELGYNAVEDIVHVHDLQATVLHLLGLNHLNLTYRFQSRDYRLTDVGGNVIRRVFS